MSPGRPTVSSPATTNGLRNTLIVFNIPESSSPSLSVKEEHDKNFWKNLCSALGQAHITPTKLVRLNWTRPGPRPIRVELSPETNAEKIILLSEILRQHETLGNTRVAPDLPWSEREARRLRKASNPSENQLRPKSIILHNVPECAQQNTNARIAHDCDQWSYIKTKLVTTVPIAAESARRLPRPAHLKDIRAPKLLRITLETEDMRNAFLEAFYTQRHLLPGGIKCHPDRDRATRQSLRGPPRITHPDVHIEGLPITHTSPTPATSTNEIPTTSLITTQPEPYTIQKNELRPTTVSA